ncbi:MAG: tetratricopeptide repeat protein, partial [Anaerolineales bacterium]|nr:tetratricopeptide repeat protein [Anaerolineales bacterium]
AALELREPPAELSFGPAPQIGLSQGLLRAGAYGGMTRRTYGVLGDEVNLAARLMQHAAPGEALASSRVYKTLTQGFEWELLEPIQVKGKREPVSLARLAGHTQGAVPRLHYAGELVGRAAELEQLTEFVAPIFTGRSAGLASLYGEPGMGKSRLVYAVRQAIEENHRVRWLTFPAEGILRQSLNPFQYGLREYFDLAGDASADANKVYFDSALDALIADVLEYPAPPELQPRVEALAQELGRTRSFLGALAGGLRWEGSLYEQVEPRLRLENTFTAVKALLLAESLRRPLVLVIEDGHALDGDSEALLAALTRNVEAFPFAVLVTSRYRDDGSRPRVPVDADVPQLALDLNQLTPAGVSAMAAQVLGGEPDAGLAAFLAEKTSGNPFFVEQLALDLRERGLAAAAGAGFTLVDRARVAAEVPDSVNAVLVARLDRLAAQIKNVVTTAAVLGNEFEVALLAQMLSDDPQLPGKVKRAEAESVWSALTEMRYLFRHSLLRDAAYSMQLQARLRELHALAGGALEIVYAADLPAHAAALAYHWGQAGHGPKEARYAALAGAQALRASAFRDAGRYVQRALDLLAAGQAREADAAPVRLNYLLGEARAGLGQLRPAQECLNISLALARAAADTPQTAAALSLLGGLALRLGEVEQAEAYLQEALGLALAIADEPAQAVIRSRLGHIARARGDNVQAERFYQESLAQARALGDQLTAANVLNALGNSALAQRQMEAGRRHFDEAQAVFRAIGYRSGVLMTLGNLGMVASAQGDHAEALRLYAEALTLADEIGDRRLQAALLDNLGDVAYDQGDDAQAQRYFADSLLLMLEVGAVPSALLALAGLAKLHARAGQTAQALQLLGLTLTHPACDDETRQRGEPALQQLRQTLPAEEAERWYQLGRALTLEAVAAEYQPAR